VFSLRSAVKSASMASGGFVPAKSAFMVY
jgi:hypothetical protein